MKNYQHTLAVIFNRHTLLNLFYEQEFIQSHRNSFSQIGQSKGSSLIIAKFDCREARGSFQCRFD